MSINIKLKLLQKGYKMRFQHFFMVALLSFGCAVNAQDDVLADALFTQGEQKLREAKTEEDHKVVFDLMKRAAESGSQKGYLYLGKLYFEGKGIQKNISKAVECWEKADKKSPGHPDGIAEAKYYLGLELFQRSVRSNDDNFRMEKLWKEAGEMGCAEALSGLGKLYWNGNEFFAGNSELSKQYFLESELITPTAENEYWLGKNYGRRHVLKKRDDISAVYWLNLAAKREYLPAHAELGLHYLNRNIFEKANFHLEKAIPLKDLEAITALNAFRVYRHEKKYGKLSPNAKKIIESWLNRARNGDSTAALTLGRYFLLRSTWKSGITFDNAAQGFFFLQYAAGLGSEIAASLSGSCRISEMKQIKSDDFTAWHKKSGDEFTKEFSEIYGSSNISGQILNDPENLFDFLQDLQQVTSRAGIFWIQDHISFLPGEKTIEFSAAGVRLSPENKLEYYLFHLNKNNDFTLKYLGDASKLLYAWPDAGYFMAAYKNREGKIIVTGIPVNDTVGTYPGNDNPEDDFYGKYGRAGFKDTHAVLLEGFFPYLKTLLKKEQKEEIAELIKYPLILNEDTPFEETIRNSDEFTARFDELFPEKFRMELYNTPDDEIFTSWMGVGFGKGLLFLSPGEKENSWQVLISRIWNHSFRMPDIFEKQK